MSSPAKSPVDVAPLSNMERLKIGSRRWHWFGRGFVIGLMLMAALNAASYFVRSEGISNLIGATDHQREAVGFPWEVWQRGKTYGHYLFDFPAILANGGIGVAIGVGLGAWAARKQHWLNRVVERTLELEPKVAARSLRFSVKSLMVASGFWAVGIALMMRVSIDPQVLGVIFFFGPALMIVFSMAPPRLKWEHRIFILLAGACALIGTAIWVGHGLGLEFDKTLMGIFICWTPQSVAGVVLMLLWTVWVQR